MVKWVGLEPTDPEGNGVTNRDATNYALPQHMAEYMGFEPI